MAKYYREDRANTIAAKAALAKATASTRNPVTTQSVELTGKPGNAPHVAASKFKVPTELKVPEKVRAAALAKSNTEMREQARAAGWGKSKLVAAQMKATDSASTARAIEHAKAAGPSLREQAEKARAAKDRTGIEPRFRANMAKDIRKIRAGNAELAAGINNPPAGTSKQEMIDRVTEKAKAFMKTSKLKAETPVGRGGGDDIKYRAMARTIKRALRIARSQ